MAVFVILSQVVPPLVEDSHLTTDPVFPDNVRVAPLELLQTELVRGDMVPPTDAGEMVTVAIDVILLVHTPLCTVARYFVVNNNPE